MDTVLLWIVGTMTVLGIVSGLFILLAGGDVENRRTMVIGVFFFYLIPISLILLGWWYFK